MTRTQLILEPWQLEALRSTAEREGGSISSVVRRILTEALGGRLGTGKRSPGSGRAAPAVPSIADIDGILRDEGFSARDHDIALYGYEVPPPHAPQPGVIAARDRNATGYGARPPAATPAPTAPPPARKAAASSRTATATRARKSPAARKRS